MAQTFKVGHLPSITWNRLHLNEASVETALSGNLPGSRYLSLPQGASVRTLSFAQALAEIEKTASFDLSQFGGEVPGDDFYFTAQQ